MRSSRSRLLMVGCVAAVAALSVGATAYAAENEQSGSSSTVQASAVQVPTAGHTPRANDSAATAAPTPVATATVDAAAQAAETGTLDDGTATEGTTAEDASGTAPSDGNVVEVRTPDPAAIPTTVAEREYFYGLITQCMNEAGYDWQAVVYSTDGVFAGVDLPKLGNVDPALQAGFTLALDGDTGGGDYYHWADAGCWGYAVHVTGNDGNN